MVDFTLRPLVLADLPACVALVAESPLWRRYGYGALRCEADLRAALEAGDALFCAERGGAAVGFAWVLPRGGFGRMPYLKLLAVAEVHRGLGIGAALLKAAEGVGRGDLLILVSDFNEAAQRFYLREGFVQVGALPDFALPGVTERILLKRR